MPPPADPPKWTPKNQILHDEIYDACVFDISRYFKGKCFDRVWGYHPAPNGPLKHQFLQQLLLEL